jgi:DNA-binding MarR family transcriptional regulator
MQSMSAPTQTSETTQPQPDQPQPAQPQPDQPQTTQTPAQPQAKDGPAHSQTPDPLARDLYALVIYMHKDCNSDLFEAVGALDLTLTQIKLLHFLEDAEEPLTLKDGAGLVKVSLPAASRLVDDLVRRGLAERHEDLEDRRMKRVTLTDDGRAAIRRLNAARLSGLQEFVDRLNGPERELLQTAVAKLLERPEVAACRPEESP